MLKVEVIGNIGKDAEVKDFNGTSYVCFSVAHTDRRKEQNTADATTWVSVFLSGNGGKLLPYLKKGTKVFVRGHLSVKTYMTKNNTPQTTININATEVELCGVKGESQSQQDNNRFDDLPF